MPGALSDFLLGPLAAAGAGLFVRLVNNVTGQTIVSAAGSAPSGLFSLSGVPAGSYTLSTGPGPTGPWTLVSSAYTVGEVNLQFNVRDFGAVGNGVADDSTAINTAIAAAAAAGGGVVFVPPGTYRCASTISLAGDQIVLQGAGWSSIIRAANGLNADLVRTPVGIRSYCEIRNLQLDGNKGNQSAGHVVHFYGTRYCVLDRCLVINAFDHALSLDGDGTNFAFNSQVTNNVFDLNNGVITDQFNEACYIANNQFKFCGAGHMCNLTSGGHFIIGNVFGASGTYTVPALELANSLTIKVIGNRFDNCRHQGVKCNSGNHLIVGNEFFKCCSATSNTESVIHIGGNSGTLVVGNVVRTDAAATWQYAVTMDGGGNSNLVASNQLTAGLTGAVNPVGNATAVRGNIGYNPLGAAAITVGASPFTYTNADSVPEYVTIDGGTITTVVKDTLTLYNFGAAAARCAVWLEPGEAVTVTYTVAPTMRKDRK